LENLQAVELTEAPAPAFSLIPPPQAEPAKWRSLALAILVHGLLIGALFLGVQWKNQPPTAVQVEVWRAAPAPVVQPEPGPVAEPPPEPKAKPPLKPDIVLKDEKPPKKEEPKKPEAKKEGSKKEEPKKPEPKKEGVKKEEAKKEEPKKPDPAPRTNFDEELKREQKQIEQQKAVQDQRARAETEARQLSQLKEDQAAATRARRKAAYIEKVKGKIRGNIVLPSGIQGNPEAIFEVTQLPSGEVLQPIKIRQSSGNPLLDAAIERAILKSSPLPKPDQPELFDRSLRIPYRPLDE
jgi:colicin import membrane protein